MTSRERHDDALAQHARWALAATTGGTLAIDGLDCAGDAAIEVVLYEDGGEPRFLCEAGSPVARAAARARPARLEVGCCRRAGCRRQVTFEGRLTLLDTDRVDGTDVHVVALDLSGVSVRQPDGARIDLPLQHYRAASGEDCESLAAYAERVVRHTNSAHATALRSAAAAVAGTIPELLIAAEIADLHGQGFTMHWIGADGARSCPVSFPRAAHTPGDLAVLLRSALTGGQAGAR